MNRPWPSADEQARGRAYPVCPPGCVGCDCHCACCGESGVALDADGYCEACCDCREDDCETCATRLDDLPY